MTEQHVFIVDDEPSACAAMCEALGGSGVVCSSFEHASDCLEQLGRRDCDLLITDLRMPDMDGIELLKRARSVNPLLPVMIITGYGDVPTAVSAIKAGATDFIEKPLDKRAFVNVVTSILGEKTRNTHPPQPLTPSEYRVLQLIIEGKTNREIGELLKRSRRTIEIHRSRIMRKLRAETLVDLVKRAVLMGLVDWSSELDQNKTE